MDSKTLIIWGGVAAFFLFWWFMNRDKYSVKRHERPKYEYIKK